MDKKRERMKELTELLTKAGKAYYQESREIMSNFEYDRLYDELSAPGSKKQGSSCQEVRPRQVGYEVLERASERDVTKSRCFLLTRQKSVEVTDSSLSGSQKVPAVLENGWSDRRPDLSRMEHLQRLLPEETVRSGKLSLHNARVFSQCSADDCL